MKCREACERSKTKIWVRQKEEENKVKQPPRSPNIPKHATTLLYFSGLTEVSYPRNTMRASSDACTALTRERNNIHNCEMSAYSIPER